MPLSFVQGDGAATERHRMRIQQRLGLGADVDAQLLGGGGDDPQRFSQLLLGLVSEGTARIPGGLDQGCRSVGSLLRDAVQHGAALPSPG
jgi:hypothetical protein